MKGIILAGGTGSRLFPSTLAVSKQLMPVYDKPMIYYPFSIMMLAGIREVMIISTPHDIGNYQLLFSDGLGIGMDISYCVQDRPNGLAEAFLLGEEFLDGGPGCLILGDNIFYGHDIEPLLKRCVSVAELLGGACILGHQVQDPHRYGIVEFDDQCNAIGIEEKPENPKSNYAVPGLYFYDNHVVEYVKSIRPSARGELEITDLNKMYLERGTLAVELMKRGYAWFDAGTHKSLLEASQFVQTIQDRQGLKIACLEEIAYRKGYIDFDALRMRAEAQSNSEYGQYLFKIIKEVECDSRR